MLENLMGDEVVVMVVLPIKDTAPLNTAPVELAAPFMVIAPVNQTGVDTDVVRDLRLVHNAPSIGK